MHKIFYIVQKGILFILLRFTVFAFLGTFILNGSAWGRDTMASKSLLLNTNTRPSWRVKSVDPWVRRPGDAAAHVSSSKTFFFIDSVYTNDVLNACVHV